MKKTSPAARLFMALIAIAAGAALIWLGYNDLQTDEGRQPGGRGRRRSMLSRGASTCVFGGLLILAGVIWIIDLLIDSLTDKNIVRNPQYTTLLNGAFEGKENKKKYKLFISAMRNQRDGDYDKAMDKLDALLAKCENGDEKSRVYTLMAMCYEDCENHNEAAKAYCDAFAADGEKTYLLKRVVEQYKQAGQYLQAYLKLKEIVGKDSNNVKALIDAGEMCVVAERYSDAVEYGERAVELSENHSEAYMILCKAYRGLGDREKCQQNLNRYRVREGNTNALSYEEVWLSETEEVSE